MGLVAGFRQVNIQFRSKMASKPKLYNGLFCPFAQRAWIALLEKGVDFECVEVNPYKKTPEWLAISPKGFVPTIVHNGKSVYESAISSST